jgi:hypothetical protein
MRARCCSLPRQARHRRRVMMRDRVSHPRARRLSVVRWLLSQGGWTPEGGCPAHGLAGAAIVPLERNGQSVVSATDWPDICADTPTAPDLVHSSYFVP